MVISRILSNNSLRSVRSIRRDEYCTYLAAPVLGNQSVAQAAKLVCSRRSDGYRDSFLREYIYYSKPIGDTTNRYGPTAGPHYRNGIFLVHILLLTIPASRIKSFRFRKKSWITNVHRMSKGNLHQRLNGVYQIAHSGVKVVRNLWKINKNHHRYI